MSPYDEPSVILPALSVLFYLMSIIFGGAETRWQKTLAGLCILSAFMGGVASGLLLTIILKLSLTWHVVSGGLSGAIAAAVALHIYSQRKEV